MGNKTAKIIPFPTQKKAMNIISLDDEIQELYEQFLVTKKDEVFRELIVALQENFEEDRALHLFEQYYPNIEKNIVNKTLDSLFIEILIDCYEIERAEILLIKKLKLYQQKNIDTFELHQTLELLKSVQNNLTLDIENSIEEIIHSVECVDKLSFYEQQNLFPKLKLLTNEKDYIYAVETLLESDNFHPLLKSYLIEEILKKAIYHKLEVNWFGQKQIINFDKLITLDEDQIILEIRQKINQRDISDFEKDILNINGFLYLCMLYPFIRDVVTDVDQFINVFLKKIQEKPITSSETNMSKWLDTLENYVKMMEESY